MNNGLERVKNQFAIPFEINIAPRILTNFTGVMPSQFKKDLDSYLKTRSPVTFLSELRSNLQVEGATLNHKTVHSRLVS